MDAIYCVLIVKTPMATANLWINRFRWMHDTFEWQKEAIWKCQCFIKCPNGRFWMAVSSVDRTHFSSSSSSPLQTCQLKEEEEKKISQNLVNDADVSRAMPLCNEHTYNHNFRLCSIRWTKSTLECVRVRVRCMCLEYNPNASSLSVFSIFRYDTKCDFAHRNHFE